MTDIETKILEAAKSVDNYNGYGYKLVESLYRQICRIMGYEITTFRYGQWSIRNLEDREKCRKIVHYMKDAGYIKISKSGQCYKMVK